MVNYYTITRVSKELYLVKSEDEIVQECSSYQEAQNFIFLKQSEELMQGVLHG